MKGLIIAIVALLAVIAYLYISKLNLENKLILCEASSTHLKEGIEFQNQAINKIKKDKTQYERTQAKREKQIITQIQAVPAPVNKDGITCQEAINYIIKLESSL